MNDISFVLLDIEECKQNSISNQHYPPGTQENYNIIMEKGKELKYSRRAESASLILMKDSRIREADSDDRGFPYI
jgi:hypothetical protein